MTDKPVAAQEPGYSVLLDIDKIDGSLDLEDFCGDESIPLVLKRIRDWCSAKLSCDSSGFRATYERSGLSPAQQIVRDLCEQPVEEGDDFISVSVVDLERRINEALYDHAAPCASPASAPADCSPTLTECPRCHNDVKKCDGVFAAPTTQSTEDRKYAEREDYSSDACRLALELECLLLDCKDTAITAKWWESAHEALEQHRQLIVAMQEDKP